MYTFWNKSIAKRVSTYESNPLLTALESARTWSTETMAFFFTPGALRCSKILSVVLANVELVGQCSGTVRHKRESSSNLKLIPPGMAPLFLETFVGIPRHVCIPMDR